MQGPLNNLPTFTQRHEVGLDETFPLFDATDLGKFEDGTKIEFPELEHYGFDHGEKTAKLATVILSHLGPQHNNVPNLRALWTAALFHDIGRQAPLEGIDPGHGERGARILERILRGMPDLWADGYLRDTACKLVANHSEKPDLDPLARALWDADCFEAARYKPGTPEGLRYLKKRTATENLCTPWAKGRDRLRTYMDFRGW